MSNLERFEEIEIEDKKINALWHIETDVGKSKDNLEELIEINKSTLQELKSLQIKMNQWGYTLGILVIILIARG